MAKPKYADDDIFGDVSPSVTQQKYSDEDIFGPSPRQTTTAWGPSTPYQVGGPLEPPDNLSKFEKLMIGIGNVPRKLYLGAQERLSERNTTQNPTPWGGIERKPIPPRSEQDKETLRREIDQQNQVVGDVSSRGMGLLGNVLGGVGTFSLPAILGGPAAAGPVANTAISALGGALEPIGSSDGSVLRNTLFRGGLGALGSGINSLMGKVVSGPKRGTTPDQERLAGILKSEGVPLTAAQETKNKALALTDAAFENLPLTAANQQAIVRNQNDAFTNAVMRRLGVQNPSLASKEEIDAAQRAISNQYTDISSRNNANLLTPENLSTLYAMRQANDAKGVFRNKEVNDIIEKGIAKAKEDMGQGPGVIPGSVYQDIRSALGAKAQNIGVGEVANAYKGVQKAMDQAARSSISPADRAAWDAADKSWQAMKAVRRASESNPEGHVYPQSLFGFVNKAEKNYPQDFIDLAKGGATFLKPLKDSGTAQRALYQGYLSGGPLLAFLGSGLTNPVSAAATIASVVAPLAAQKTMNSGIGQSYLKNGINMSAPGLRLIPQYVPNAFPAATRSLPVALGSGLQDPYSLLKYYEE